MPPPRATLLGSLVVGAVLLASVSAYGGTAASREPAPVSLATRHAYGHILFDGGVDGLEIFRATFGGLMPCGQYELVRAPDENGLLCNATKETLEGSLIGKYVMATRGVCSFFDKAKLAVESGAAGLVVINSSPGLFRASAGNLTANYTTRPLDIPIVMIKQANGKYFEHIFRFVNSVNATLTPYREACAVVDREARKAYHLRWLEAQAQALANATAAAAAAAALNGTNADGTNAAAAPTPVVVVPPIASESASAVVTDTKELDRAVLESLFNERAAGASQSENEERARTDTSGGSSGSGGNGGEGNSEVAAGGRSGILKGSETADLHFSLENEGDHGFFSAQEKELVEEVIALNGHHEAVAAIFSGPMIRQASLPVAFAQPFDACKAALEEVEETVEEGEEGNRTTITRKVMRRTSLDHNVNGTYAIVYRGGCSMIQKARNMEASGAAGMLIVNTGVDPASPVTLEQALNEDEWMDCRYGGLCPLASSGGSKDSLEAHGGKPGAAAAIGDDTVSDNPIHMAVLMVPAAAGARWRWLVTSSNNNQNRSLEDIRGLRLRLIPRTARGDGWLGLERDLQITGSNGLRLAGGPTLPSDPYNRQQTLLRLLYRNHPASSEGHLERFLYARHWVKAISDKNSNVTALSTAGGSIVIKNSGSNGFSYYEEFQALEDSEEWKEGVDPTGPKFLGRERHTVTPITVDSPSSLFLMKRVPLGRIARDDQEPGPLQCSYEAGNSFTVRGAPLELKFSSSALIRRVSDLLIQQACLEKWLLMNAASLGGYVALLRKEVNDDDWVKLSTALLRPYGITASSDIRHTYASYLELAARYEMGLLRGEQWPPHEGDKVGDWVEGTLHHEMKKAEEEEAAAREQGKA
jgi:PA domain